jgi:hypothetical protein
LLWLILRLYAHFLISLPEFFFHVSEFLVLLDFELCIRKPAFLAVDRSQPKVSFGACGIEVQRVFQKACAF